MTLLIWNIRGLNSFSPLKQREVRKNLIGSVSTQTMILEESGCYGGRIVWMFKSFKSLLKFCIAGSILALQCVVTVLSFMA